MTEIKCGRCGEAKDESSFNVSQRQNGKWCVACYRDWHRQRYTPHTLADDSPRPCDHCGRMFSPKTRRPAMYCSRQCKTQARNANAAAERKSSKPTRQCVHCGNDMPQAMRADAKFCSQECNSAAHAVTRKMAKRAARSRTPGDPLIERNAIAARDKYHCQLCGGKVDMQRKHPDPLCASIDHVIPLARGGTNDLANLQLAHLRCNLRKREACITPEQLRLVG